MSTGQISARTGYESLTNRIIFNMWIEKAIGNTAGSEEKRIQAKCIVQTACLRVDVDLLVGGLNNVLVTDSAADIRRNRAAIIDDTVELLHGGRRNGAGT